MADITSKEFYQKANEAFVDENYEEALQLYNKAIELDPNNDQYYNSLSQLFLKQNNYSDALKYASFCLNLNPDNVSAYLKKGIAEFHLGNYESSRLTFEDGLTKKGNDLKLLEWLDKCKQKMSKDDSVTKVVQSLTTTPQDSITLNLSNNPLKTKYDWYQTETHIVITILVKNVQSDQIKYNVTEKSLSCGICQPFRPEYSLELDLAHPIRPDELQIKILSTKVEIKLKKQEGIRWNKLEHDENMDNIKSFITDPTTKPTNTINTKSWDQENPVLLKKYPSSSQHNKDWDRLVHEIKEEEKDEKLEGDAALNQLFQQIYADGSDEVKKAMMKSFSESGGTVLSTNWKEIGEKKVEVKPPDGMEFKKW